jgi:hypothetical protein
MVDILRFRASVIGDDPPFLRPPKSPDTTPPMRGLACSVVVSLLVPCLYPLRLGDGGM